jgi:hypothetical protein
MNEEPGYTRMRFCSYPDKIVIDTVEVPVEGDSPIRIKTCGRWKDCGLLEKGLLKNTV